jgi:hypothetical protein
MLTRMVSIDKEKRILLTPATLLTLNHFVISDFSLGITTSREALTGIVYYK